MQAERGTPDERVGAASRLSRCREPDEVGRFGRMVTFGQRKTNFPLKKVCLRIVTFLITLV